MLNSPSTASSACARATEGARATVRPAAANTAAESTDRDAKHEAVRKASSPRRGMKTNRRDFHTRLEIGNANPASPDPPYPARRHASSRVRSPAAAISFELIGPPRSVLPNRDGGSRKRAPARVSTPFFLLEFLEAALSFHSLGCLHRLSEHRGRSRAVLSVLRAFHRSCAATARPWLRAPDRVRNGDARSANR